MLGQRRFSDRSLPWFCTYLGMLVSSPTQQSTLGDHKGLLTQLLLAPPPTYPTPRPCDNAAPHLSDPTHC